MGMRFSARQKDRLYGELAKLLRAGFSIDDAARAILERSLSPAGRRYLEDLRAGLAAKQSIGESVAQSSLPLSPLELSVVDAGERGGRLEESFEHLSGYFRIMEQTRKRILGGLVYPVILLHVAVIVPAIPRAILGGDATIAHRSIATSLLAVYLGAAIAVFTGSRMAWAARRNAFLDRLLSHLPLIGKARRSLALARFCKVFHIHLLAALPISRSIRAAGEASQAGNLCRDAELVAEGVEGGATLAEGMCDRSGFPAEFAASLSTAELSGTLDLDLERWSRAYQEAADAALDHIAEWFPKALYVIVVLYVGWRIIGMGLAYIGALEGYLEG